MTDNDKGLDARARRAARRCGLVARKSRWRRNSVDNLGGFQVINPQGNYVVAGARFTMTADGAIAFCSERDG
jgi:hypothetical protein